MNQADFDNVVERRLNLIRKVLESKGKEYGVDHDRLYNFKEGAALLGGTQAQALLGYLVKHLVSVVDLVRRSGGPPSQDVADEKIGDAINYLILLEAIFVEERSKMVWREGARLT